MSGNFVEDSGEESDDIHPITYVHREGIAICACDAGLVSSAHQDELSHLNGDVRDVEVLNGMLRRISRILTVRSVKICSCCRLLMLGS